MPELPEVYTITQDLAKYVVGSTINKVSLEKGFTPKFDFEKFKKAAIGSEIKNVERVSKNIVIELSPSRYINVHLRLTGRLLLRSAGSKKDQWQKMTLHLEKKSKKFELRYADKRKLGTIEIMSKKELEEFRKKFGPEMLDDELDSEKLLIILQQRNTNVKNALLDQGLVAGMGNAYATDALWMAKIHPETKTSALGTNESEALLKASRKILNEGIKNRGISMSDYVDLFGKKGKQQEYFRVYRQTNCPTCSSKVEFIQLSGRKTYFCPICQPKNSSK